jgi:hypothetical protein
MDDKELAMHDLFDHYRRGMQKLLGKLARTNDRYRDVLLYQVQLEENIEATKRYGDRDETRAKRAEIIYRLNSLALETIDVSFNELCDLGLTDQEMQGAPPNLQSALFHSQFKAIAERTSRDFVGRKFLLDEVQRYLYGGAPEFTSGYVIIEGEPGIGKTAFVSRLVKLNGWVRHYVGESIITAKQFLESVCAQLKLHYHLETNGPLYDPTNPSGLLIDLLDRALAQPANRPVVILLDALDEASDADLPPKVSRLYLPRDLPNGAYIVATTRPQRPDLQRLWVRDRKSIPLKKDDPRNRDDVHTYIRAFADKHKAPMAARIAEWGVDRERFSATVLDKSEGNFMYVVSLLQDILDGRVTGESIDHIQYLPQGLEGYYSYHWDRMISLAGDDFKRHYLPVAGFVASVRSPVSIENLIQFTGLRRGEVVDVLTRWKQFFYETTQDGRPMYTLYHASFRSFLDQQVGLATFEAEIKADFLRNLGVDPSRDVGL